MYPPLSTTSVQNILTLYLPTKPSHLMWFASVWLSTPRRKMCSKVFKKWSAGSRNERGKPKGMEFLGQWEHSECCPLWTFGTQVECRAGRERQSKTTREGVLGTHVMLWSIWLPPSTKWSRIDLLLPPTQERCHISRSSTLLSRTSFASYQGCTLGGAKKSTLPIRYHDNHYVAH